MTHWPCRLKAKPRLRFRVDYFFLRCKHISALAPATPHSPRRSSTPKTAQFFAYLLQVGNWIFWGSDMANRSTISFRVDQQTRKILQARAKAAGKTLAGFCLDAVETSEFEYRIAALERAVTDLVAKVSAQPTQKQMHKMLEIIVKEIRNGRVLK